MPYIYPVLYNLCALAVSRDKHRRKTATLSLTMTSMAALAVRVCPLPDGCVGCVSVCGVCVSMCGSVCVYKCILYSAVAVRFAGASLCA